MKTWAIIDLQFGSTGKGLIAGALAKRWKPTHVATAWGPNAGHTFVHSDGKTDIRTMLANATAHPDLQKVMIGPGSVIDLPALEREMDEAGWDFDRLMIHDHAIIVQDRHRAAEADFVRIGSTMKGTGRAMIERMERDPAARILARDVIDGPMRRCLATPLEYLEEIINADRLQVEGAQGFGLSLYHGEWPYCTSRDVSTHQTMADAGVPFGRAPHVIGCVRTYPIRVANRLTQDGTVYSSGPGYGDQRETTFAEIGQEQEVTTVTKLPRRIFEWSDEQYVHAVAQNGVHDVFLNFVNYLEGGQVSVDKMARLGHIRNTIGDRLFAEGRGPREDQIDFLR
jgi:adenylosuccinate synthase